MMKMRMAQVHEVYEVSPHMRRIILSGADLSTFPSDKEGAHVKVLFPQPGQKKPKLSFHLGMKKSMRSYTVRHFDGTRSLLTIDFAVKDHKGLGASWAEKAVKGDYLGIGGPGKTKYKNFQADWHLIAGDLTSLPAIAAIVEKLPPLAKGYIFIQVPTEADKQMFEVPENMKLNWLVNSDVRENKLLHSIEEIKCLEGSPAIFIAGEYAQVKEIHGHVKLLPDYKKKMTYASAYWRLDK